MNPPRHKLPQSHKGVWGEGGGVFVIWGRGVVGGPVLEEHFPNAGSEGPVGSSQELWWGNVRSRRGLGVKNKRKARSAFLLRQGEVCQDVNGEMFSRWGGRDLRAPAEVEVNGEEAYRKVTGRVLGSERGEGGEGERESGRGRVGVRGDACDSEGGETPLVSAVGGNGGEAGLPGKDGGGGGEKVIRSPSLNPVPEAIHASERSIVRGEEVGSVGEYREEEAVGNTVAEEGSDACSWGGEAFDEGEDGLGQLEPMPVVVYGVEGGGEPVS